MADDPRAHRSGARHPGPSSRVVVVLATVVTALALAWLIIDRLLAGYYPLQWGGPNIGRGVILAACYGLVVAGVVTVAVGGGFRLRTWTRWSWAAAAMVVVLFTAFAIVRIVEPRDEDAGTVGSLGVTVSETGDPTLVFAVCRGTIDRVQIFGPNRGSVPNEVLAQYDSSAAVGNGAVLDLGEPPVAWTTDQPLDRDGVAAQTLVIATARGDKAVLRQVSFSSADLTSLEPGQVLGGSGPFAQRRPRADFLAASCASVG